MINIEPLRKRLGWVAGTVRWLAVATMIGIVAVAVIGVLQTGSQHALLPGVVLKVELPGVPGDAVRLGLWLSLLPDAVLFYGLLRLTRMMRAFERGEFFSSLVPAHLQSFSAAVVVCELLQISLPLQVAIVRLATRQSSAIDVQLNAEGVQLLSLLLAAVFLLLAWVLREAARVAEDNAKII